MDRFTVSAGPELADVPMSPIFDVERSVPTQTDGKVLQSELVLAPMPEFADLK